jgi:hypothetical protein
LFFWQEGPKERQKKRAAKNEKSRKKDEEACGLCFSFLRVFAFLSANAVLVAAEGRAGLAMTWGHGPVE